MIYTICLVVFLLVCIVMIGVILVQRARGGGLAGAFGGGGSDTMLGSLQSHELVKFTTGLAVAFFVLAILMDFFPPQRRGANIDEITTSAPMVNTSAVPSTDTAAPIADDAIPGGMAPIEVDGAEAPAGGGGQ